MNLTPIPTYTLQYVKTYESYEAESALQTVSPESLNEFVIEEKSAPIINAEAFFYYLQDMYGISLAELPEGFGFTQQGTKISLVFGSIPNPITLMVLFSVVQTKLTTLKLDGINQVIFNAETPDEKIYHNVSSALEPHTTLIPSILNQVQIFHSNRLATHL